MYDPKTVVDLIGRNVEYAGNPFGALPLAVNRWWKGLNIPRDGNVILVTGLMFQFLPLLKKLPRSSTSPPALLRFSKHIGHIVRIGAPFCLSCSSRLAAISFENLGESDSAGPPQQ